MGDATETPPWWAAFPAPKSNVAHIEADEVLRLLEHQETAGQEASRDFLLVDAGIKRVIFYCGSSNGRGPRSANWLQDYFDDVGETTVTAVILKGGIKGWVRGYGGRMMDWYEEKVWTDLAE
ncbi:hypothetical protein Cob_v010766 [Colletotrichum orbiculare MAFF 240422]|uniref:Rhodanese domain-containing protein n=1 Tax=Colletotrichum orbiculare (strain 104-T / ATCC 96160 / CBS 514.97 / LARS 414 / MAFF 240422) TaxID=1213857 RepID=A0A484FD87_COLOR|nr:hypothetical protein Cob_v010766 [Colletotrichum orbiculare MAFF 240422]